MWGGVGGGGGGVGVGVGGSGGWNHHKNIRKTRKYRGCGPQNIITLSQQYSQLVESSQKI